MAGVSHGAPQGEGELPSPPILQEMKMVEVLSEVNWKHWVGQPIDKIKNKLQKKEPKMLEEQIRDCLPCDIEPEEDKDEEF